MIIKVVIKARSDLPAGALAILVARDRAPWVGEGRKAGDTPNEDRKAGIKKRSGRIKRGKSGLFYWESKKGWVLTIPTSTRKEAKRLQKKKTTSDGRVAHKKNASKLFRTSKSNSLIREKLFLTMEGG